jgi:hypothetical protein
MSNDLSKRIATLHKSSKKVGTAYILLFVECVETMDKNWTPLAQLISGANPKDSGRLRKMAGFVLKGWKLAGDKVHPTGLRFSKDGAASINANRLANLKALAEQGHVLQSKVIGDLLSGGDVADVKTVDAEALAKRIVAANHKRVDDGAISLLDSVIAQRMALKTLEAELAATVVVKAA